MRSNPTVVLGVLLAAFLALGPILNFEPYQDAGASIGFEDDKRIDKDISGTAQTHPDIVCSGNDVYIIWQDERSGNWDIYSRASHDGGVTFGPEVRVDDTKRTQTLVDDVSNQEYPRVVLEDDGTLYVVWQDDRDGRDLIYIGKSDDRGASFSTSRPVSGSVVGTQRNPDIAVAPSGGLHVAWEDDRDRFNNPQIYYATRGPGETDFDDDVRVSDVSTSFKCRNPAVAAPIDERVHVVWDDDRTWDLDIYMATSLDGGGSFDSSMRVSRDPTGSDQIEPDIVANGTALHVIWSDPRSRSSDIYGALSRDRGTTFETDRLLNPNQTAGHQFEPRAVMDEDGNLTISWTASPGISDRKSDIQMTVLYKNGTLDEVYTVNDPLTEVTQDQSSVAVGPGGVAHFAWRDNRNSGDQAIYYCRTTLSGEEGYAPELRNVVLNPEMGGLGTDFTFKATYFDAENDPPAPGYPKLNLFYRSAANTLYSYPGSPFNMSMVMINVNPPADFDYRNGEVFMKTVKVDRKLDLFYFISAQASSGNRTLVEAEMKNLPKVDGQGPTFKLLEPKIGEWIDSNIIQFKVLIEDDLSGVDPWSIFYQTYQEEKGGWDVWQRKGSTVPISNTSVLYTVNVTFLEGRDGIIRFRAKDVMGNGGIDDPYSVSQNYPVWVDATGPQVEIISPRSGTTFDKTLVTFNGLVKDEGSGIDPDSFKVSYSLNGVDNFGPWINLSDISGAFEEDYGEYDISFSVSLKYGYSNYVRARASDLLGNSGQSNNVQIIIKQKDIAVIDKPPSKIESIQPRISGSVRPHITWSPSFDPEGDAVTYNITVYDLTAGEPIAERETITFGNTYWDPDLDQLFTPGHTYEVTVQPHAGGLDGPNTTIELLISTDANYPPNPVEKFYPRATSNMKPVLSWDPATDPDGDTVFYFIRIGSYYGGSDRLEWTSVYTETKYAVTSTLSPGSYYVDILCSDGKDFAPISHFSLSIGIYNPTLELQRSTVTVYQGSKEQIQLEISNKGFTFDNIRVRIDGEALNRTDMEFWLGADLIEVAPGSSANTTFHVEVSENAKVGLFSLNITITSVDGVTTYTKGVSVRVVNPANPGDDDGIGPGDSQNGEGDAFALLIVFIVLLVLVIIAMAYAYYRIDKKQRDHAVEVVEKEKAKLKGPRKDREALEDGKKKKSKKALPPTK
ncbi:MAG: hypothetical protein ACMUIE_06985 [Thermoplasmatota archaeon]